MERGAEEMTTLNPPSRWQQSGRISLWRYTGNNKNYPGWHLNADAAGCQSMLDLLDAFASKGEISRVIAITAPTPGELQVPNNRGGQAGWLAPTKLRLTFSPSPTDWIFPPDLEPASLVMGAEWLGQLRQGLVGIPHGQGDFSIGETSNGSLKLWFWW